MGLCTITLFEDVVYSFYYFSKMGGSAIKLGDFREVVINWDGW